MKMQQSLQLVCKLEVHIVDKSEARLKQLVEMFGDKIIPEQSDKIDLNKLVSRSRSFSWRSFNSRSRGTQISNQEI